MLLPSFAPVAVMAVVAVNQPFSYEYSGNTDSTGQASVTLIANKNLGNVKLRVRGDGQEIVREFGDMRKGARQTIVWKQNAQRARYEVDVKSSDAAGSFAFETIKVGSAKALGQISIKPRSTAKELRDLNQAVFEVTFEATMYSFEVFNSDGETIASDQVVKDITPGERVTVEWPDDEVFLIHFKAEAPDGRTAEYKLVPWSVEIPHTEINFDSGKFDVKNNESTKLDEAVAVAMHELAAVEKANRAVGATIEPKLYIVGYTDTVGPAGANKRLSNSRARAIAEYFRDKGFWAPIFFAGMGERGLRVQTPDNIDEVRNRRALYLIGAQQPAAGGAIPGRWTKLVGARQRPPGELPPLPEKWANYREDRRAKAQADKEGTTDMSSELPEGDGASVEPSTVGEAQVEGMDYGSGGDEGGGPPPVEGEPGATNKGCIVASPTSGPPLALGWLVLVGLARRRRLTARARA